jgi:hypothetical protein
MSALQIHLFMQNKANFRKSQMNVTNLLVRDYVQMDTWSIRKNKPKTNPIQTQYKANSNPNKPNYSFLDSVVAILPGFCYAFCSSIAYIMIWPFVRPDFQLKDL